MQVFAGINCPTDEPHWITREAFYKYFDQDDFLNRTVQDVQAAYLKDWFYKSDDGRLMFYIPVVGAIAGRTDLIGSRHRLAVLLPHLEELPIAIARGHLQPDGLRFLDTIPKRPLDATIPFWIPDLPIRATLP